MRDFQPYLNFDGNAREAMTFYRDALDAELTLQTFRDAQVPAPPGAEDRVMHARLEKGPAVLMASDTMPGTEFKPGNNLHVTLNCDTLPEIESAFNALSEGGKVTMPLADQFWGARFGMLTDKFNVSWMLNCDLPRKGG
jgi:PhnB protein